MHSLIQWIRRAWEPGEISLRTYLLIGLLARLPAIFFSRGYDFLDHQFQYVDPAYHIGLGGSWWQSHDYVQGLRSWVYPGLLGGMFKFLSWLGLTDPNTMMTATRFCHGLIGLVPLAAFWTLIVRWKGWTGQRPLLLFMACNALVLASFWYPQRGPVEAALTLSRRDDFVDRLVIVDGAADALGGHYYLRRDHIEVHLVERSRLVSWIRENRPETPLYFLVVRRPLAPIQLPDSYRLESEGYFRDWPDLKRNTRRYLYRLRKSH